MDETQSMFAALRQSSPDQVVDAIEQLVREGNDRELARINALAFAKERGLDEERGDRAPSCMRRGSACSICPGTCCARAAAAFSRPTIR